MKTVLYSHDLAIAPRQLFILKENADKTVDLGIPDKPPQVIVSSCPVSDVRKAGHCVIQDEAEAAVEPVKSPADPKK